MNRCTRRGNVNLVTYTYGCKFLVCYLEIGNAVNGIVKKFIAVVVAIAMQLPGMNLAMAQSSPDIRSPVIELEVIVEAQASDSQVFTAQVIEETLLKDVLLYHRRAGQQPFIPVKMSQVENSDNFSVTLRTDPMDLRAIEYYIQARDEGGNRTVEGFAFDPYTRVLIANETVINTTTAPAAPSTETATAKSTGRLRWWHIVAGVVVVGAVASLAGGDSGENDQNADGTVPLTLNITGP